MRVYLFLVLIIAIVFAADAQTFSSDPTSKGSGSLKPSSEAEDESSIERIETRLVVSAVQVFDKKGTRVTNLKEADFEVREEGELQDIQSVTFGGSSDTGRSIVLVMDYSSSIIPYMDESLKGAETLIDLLGPNDRLAIVTDDIEVLTDFTSDKEVLKEKVNAIRAQLSKGATGKSRQFCALMKTLKELAPHAAQRPIVIFQTDGDQYALLKGNIGAIARGDNAIRYSFDDVIDLAKSTATRIFTVTPGRFIEDMPKEERKEMARTEVEARKRFMAITGDLRFINASEKVSRAFVTTWYRTRIRDQKAIVEIARKTGGWAEGLTDKVDPIDLYSRILRDGADASYSVAYYPKNEAFNGGTRNVSVTLRGFPGYSIQGQKSYAAAVRARH